MKEVITKFLLVAVAVAAVIGFVYGELWGDVKTVKNTTQTQITANGATALSED